MILIYMIVYCTSTYRYIYGIISTDADARQMPARRRRDVRSMMTSRRQRLRHLSRRSRRSRRRRQLGEGFSVSFGVESARAGKTSKL